MAHIAFDIGGTSLRVALVTDGGLGEVRKVSTPQDPKEGIAALTALIREVAGNEEIKAIAGGFPGTILEGVVIDAPNLPKWKDLSLGRALSEVMPGTSISLANDADMAGLGEAIYGAGKGKRVVAYVGIGTGVGGGRIVDGTVDAGVYGLEPGHQIIDAKDTNDLESLVSGKAFEKRFGVSPKDAPRSAYDEMTPILTIGLYNTIVHWSPEVLVLGGSMIVGVNGYSVESVNEGLTALCAKRGWHAPDVTMASLGDAAGLHGARALLLK